MRIDFADDLFDIRQRPMDVLGLLALCQRMGHTIGSREPAVEAWADTLSPPVGAAADRLLAQHRARLGTVGTAYRLTVSMQPTDWQAGRLDLEDAWRFLRAPLEVLLENERGDWCFLRRLANPQQRALLDEALRRGAMAIRQGGGISELTKSVIALFEEPLDTTQRVRRLRTWVMFDRDADTADNRQPDEASIAARDACTATEPSDPWSIAFHQLKRRHIESYLPDRLLGTWSSSQSQTFQAAAQAVAALRASNPAAADSLHMKGGLRMAFSRDVRTELRFADSPNQTRRRDDEATLNNWPLPWPNVAAELRADLLAGFGSGIGDLFDTASPGYDSDFRAEFGKRESKGARLLVESLLERL